MESNTLACFPRCPSHPNTWDTQKQESAEICAFSGLFSLQHSHICDPWSWKGVGMRSFSNQPASDWCWDRLSSRVSHISRYVNRVSNPTSWALSLRLPHFWPPQSPPWVWLICKNNSQNSSTHCVDWIITKASTKNKDKEMHRARLSGKGCESSIGAWGMPPSRNFHVFA